MLTLRLGALGFFLGALPSGCVAPVDLGGGVSESPSSSTATPPTALPPVAGPITNVTTTVTGDSVGIDFDPVDDAIDYRVYPLPADDDVIVNADHTVTVRNAIYRCAGARATYDLENNLNAADMSLVRTRGTFSWTATIADDPTLGYVYSSPGPAEKPVYALAGKPSTDEAGWRESRTKIYTADEGERSSLLAQNYRDDGIVFYVPGAASTDTTTIYRSVSSTNATDAYQHYFAAADLAAHQSDTVAPTAAFEVLTAAPAGATTKPLQVVGYDNSGHDELSVGKERFARASHQGAGPLWHLEWSGLTAKTTLVVEALDGGCPYQGFLTAEHVDAPPHQPYATLDDLRQGSTTGEVFVNGQFDVTTLPNAIARSFVTVAPAPLADWDWSEGFDEASLGPLTAVPTTNDCFQCVRQQSQQFDVDFTRLDASGSTNVLAYGEVLGQLWLAYDDTNGGTLGTGQFTALDKAAIDPDSDKYLHVAFSTGIASTLRRYPQLLISDQDAPIYEGLKNPDNNTVIFEARGGPEVTLDVAAVHGLVNGNAWAVDDPDPDITRHVLDDPSTPSAPSPLESPFEHAGIDRMTQFDVYLSSARFYVFMDGKPAGCTILPASVVLGGPVTVTFGDVLFDETAEPEVCSDTRPYDFLHRHQCHETSRHFDNLAFKSGAALAAWDESRVPCLAY